MLDGVEAFILAGGSSRRMGTPKALLEVGGMTIIARLAELLSSVFGRVTIVTDRPDEVSFLKLPVIPDVHAARGPLGGLHASLAAATEKTIFLASTDLPFLSAEFLTSLRAHHGTTAATVASDGVRIHPLAGYYDSSLLPQVEAALTAGLLSVVDFLRSVGPAIVPLSALQQPDDVLLNVNTPEDLEKARRLIKAKE